MNLNEIKERVAAGLRNMNYPPSALLFCGETPGVPGKIAGTPVLMSAYIHNTYSDNDVPFIPVWDDASGYYPLWKERRLFEAGFLGEC